tara:strand:- start:129 stop:1361 length:1233 start_codon:yes stop_codon:yes gene_type:complete
MTAKRRAVSAAERTTDPWRNRIVGQGDEAPDQLLANPSNWRIHPTAQREALAAVLDDVGWVQRVIVNRTTQHVVDGHLRVALALSRDEPTIPVNYVELDEREEALVLAALDPIAAMAATDKDKLRELLEQAQVTDEALRDQLNDVAGMTAALTEGETDPDAVPDERATEIERGDLFALGDHRLLCGDCTAAEDVARLLDGSIPFICVTDPPYGVNYDPGWRRRAGVNKNPNKQGKVKNDEQWDWGDAWKLSKATVIYVWHADRFAAVVADTIEQNGFDIRAQIIWAKDRMTLSRGDYHWQHEPCWYAVRSGSKAERTNDRTQTTLWAINARDDSGHGHGTQKPVECMLRPIKNHTFNVVYDPFVGSGTTIIAAEQLGRRCYAIEIAPTYCQVTIDRWEAFTGEKAKKVQP